MKHLYLCFPNGRRKALTLSYDDGRIEDRRLVSIFNRYGLKATFHLNSGYLEGKDIEEESRYGKRISAGEAAALYQGHEIACHTVTHPTMERTPFSNLIGQIMEDRMALERLAGYPVCGFSYPNGSSSDEIKGLLKNLGIEYARTVGNTDGFAMPKDFMEWKATCHHSHRLLELTEEFLSRDKDQLLELMYVWGHSYEFTRDDNWELIEEFAAKAGGRKEIWYAANIEIVRYKQAFDRLIFMADSSAVYNPSSISVWLDVDGSVIEAVPGKITNIVLNP